MSLSEEQLVECDTHDLGCNGGLQEWAFQYLAKAGSISEEDYPYTAGNGGIGTCRASYYPIAATVKSYTEVRRFRKKNENLFKKSCQYSQIPSRSEPALQQAVGTVGPVCVGIDAAHSSFIYYSGGVYYEPQCSEMYLDHGVLVTGYGNYNGDDYWMVKNSWGNDWGLNGFIMMSRNRNNNCGIASQAGYPVV